VYNHRAALAALVALLICGCQWAGFYGQAIRGQIDILARQRPIAQLTSSPQTPETLRQRLSLVLEIRRFAGGELLLPVGGHFLEYADLGRPEAVYCVFAAPEFSLDAKTWCYPFVGCAAYRGYFSKADARDYADRLAAEGYDTAVGGAPAYSTLGWFADPVLNTFIFRYPEDLAGLIFHELAHQIFYAADDTTFNESFATAVEQEGVRRWLQAGHDGDIERYRKNRERRSEVLDLIDRHRRRLASLYATNQPDTAKRRAKADIFADLKSEYRRLLRTWGATGDDNAWLQQPLNNAHLVSVESYHDLVPAFHDLLEACRGNLDAFYSACKRLAEMPREERRRMLASPHKLLTPAG
jgi:predicted aminopeptidase